MTRKQKIAAHLHAVVKSLEAIVKHETAPSGQTYAARMKASHASFVAACKLPDNGNRVTWTDAVDHCGREDLRAWAERLDANWRDLEEFRRRQSAAAQIPGITREVGGEDND